MADPKILAKLTSRSTEGWPQTQARIVGELRIAERDNFRSWLWEWFRQLGVDLPNDARLIDAVLAFVQTQAEREQQAKRAGEIAARAKLMPAVEFQAWVESVSTQAKARA